MQAVKGRDCLDIWLEQVEEEEDMAVIKFKDGFLIYQEPGI